MNHPLLHFVFLIFFLTDMLYDDQVDEDDTAFSVFVPSQDLSHLLAS